MNRRTSPKATRAGLRAGLALTLTLLLGSLLASAAEARSPYRAPCLGDSGPKCSFWTAKVVQVADGDTIRVRIAGARVPRGVQTVRLSGINAMEMTRYSNSPRNYRGECHAVAATRYVYDMVKKAGGRVRLAAQNTSSRSGFRLRRQVSVRVGGQWVDLARHQLSQGLALSLVNRTEAAWDHIYGTLAQQAQSARAGLYDTSSCGVGPSENARLRLSVKWNADGSDEANVNGEWARISNDGDQPVSLAGWWLRDSAYRGPRAHGYTFPAGTVVPAHGAIKLHVGRGQRTATAFFWGLREPVWENPGVSNRYAGDGGYLFDPQGDLRAWMSYPCLVSCSKPIDHALRVTPHPAGIEWVDITNVSSAPVSLDGYHLSQDPIFYAFDQADVLPPGTTLRLYMQQGLISPGLGELVRSWGRPPNELGDRQGTVQILSDQGHRAACGAWGTARC